MKLINKLIKVGVARQAGAVCSLTLAEHLNLRNWDGVSVMSVDYATDRSNCSGYYHYKNFLLILEERQLTISDISCI